MITVTNGTVSRTVKPADYEARTVTLSFNCDPGDDLDAGIENLLALAEKHAKASPRLPFEMSNPVQEKKRRLTGDELVGDAHAPDQVNLNWVAQPMATRKPRLDKDPNDPLPPAMAAPTEVALTPVSVSAPELEPVAPAVPATLEALVEAARAAVARVGVERRGEVVAVNNQFLDEPNAPLRTMAEGKRAAAIAALSDVH